MTSFGYPNFAIELKIKANKHAFRYFSATYMTVLWSCHNNRHELTNCVRLLSERSFLSEAKAAIG